MPTTFIQLASLYSRLKEWTSVSDFEADLDSYFLGERSAAELSDLRARHGGAKKLSDEIIPALHYLRLTKAQGEIRFAFDNAFPDCWIRQNSSAVPQGIEITVAQARERHLLGKELNEKGVGRGFIGLPDDTPSRVFSERLAQPRVMYSTEHARRVITDGIKGCLTKKKKPKYAGLDLLIEAPLRCLPDERWNAVMDELRREATQMPFREIYVIGNNDSKPFGFRIK